MRAIALSFLVLVMTLGVTNAFACDCVSPTTVSARHAQASVVFSGRVIASRVSTTPNWTRSYRFQVIERFKGAIPSEVVLEQKDSDCTFRFEDGTSYLVYAYGKDRLYANICSATQELSGAQAEIEVLKKIVDSTTAPRPRPNGYFLRNTATGVMHLRVHEFNMREATTFTVHELWRFDPVSDQWLRQPFTPTTPKKVVRGVRQVYGAGSDTTIAPITNRIGLFWVKWTENGTSFEDFAFAGMSCNDIDIGTPPAGFVATCIPYADHAEAAFVPDPRTHCVTAPGGQR